MLKMINASIIAAGVIVTSVGFIESARADYSDPFESAAFSSDDNSSSVRNSTSRDNRFTGDE